MTQAELVLLVNTILGDNIPIQASMHRAAEGHIISEMYNAESRGKVLAVIATVLALEAGDKVLIIRGEDAKLIDADELGGDGGGPTITFKVDITPTGTINGTNPNFTLPEAPAEDSLQLFIDGLRVKGGGIGYTLTGANIVCVTPPETDITADYQI